MKEIRGIDVSKWQGEIDWKKVKESGIEFAMVRASYGIDGIDKFFKQNAENAYKHGINVGAYHYCYAVTNEQSIKEANHFLNIIKGYNINYPVVVDVEDKCQKQINKNNLTNIVLAFLKVIENAGYYSMLYANKSWLNSKIDINKIKNYDVWLAEWRQGNYTYEGNFGIWQYTDQGKVNGINGNVDMNISYKDYADIIMKKGLNNFKQQSNNNASPEWQISAFEELIKSGVIATPEYWKNKLKENITVGEVFGILRNIIK